jgi:hypothetical protein
VSIYSDLDQLVIPRDSARLDHPDVVVRNVLRRGVGHLSLPIDRRAVHEIVTALAHLDTDGATSVRGSAACRALRRRSGPEARASESGSATGHSAGQTGDTILSLWRRPGYATVTIAR